MWPTQTYLGTDDAMYTCTCCKRDKDEPKRYSAENDMLPGDVPPYLRGLSHIEEMLIARAYPIMAIYRKHGGQRGYCNRGHVLNLPQDVQGFLDHLPRNVHELSILVLRHTGEDNTHTDLRVRRVFIALKWLQTHNPFYANITIDHVALRQLPDDGIPPELMAVDDVTQQQVASDDDGTQDKGTDSVNSHSFLPMLFVQLLMDRTSSPGPP